MSNLFTTTAEDDIALYNTFAELGYFDDASHRALELERQGWQVWLETLFPFVFRETFSKEHQQYWEKLWSVLHRIRAQKQHDILHNGTSVVPYPKDIEIENAEMVLMLILGRGLGKSAALEAGAIMRAAIVGSGYALFISESSDQAEEHLRNCKILIEHPESLLLSYYPQLAIEEASITNDKVKGAKGVNRREIFMCCNGWVARAKGLDSLLRGLRIGGQRPDDIILDDLDGVNDSVYVSTNKLRQLTTSVIPTQARQHSTIKFAQNLITNHSVASRLYTGKTDALSERTIIGVANAFEKFDYELVQTEDGRAKYQIMDTSVPTWDGLDIARAQKFLNDSGLEAFLAEYQNSFEHLANTLVIPQYNEDIHIITWSQFRRVFGVGHIPNDWGIGVGHDVGYTATHPSAWSFIAVSGMNTPMPGKYFLYRGRTFTDKDEYDQAETILKEVTSREREQIKIWRMSHEARSERLVYNRKFGMKFMPCDAAKTAGVSEFRFLLKPDTKTPHPFHEDTRNEDGTYKLGSPQMFWIVDDQQFRTPRNDAGLALHREQIQTWRYRAVKETESGFSDEQPLKKWEDTCDATRMITQQFRIIPTSLTSRELAEAEFKNAVRNDPRFRDLSNSANMAGIYYSLVEELDNKLRVQDYERDIRHKNNPTHSIIDYARRKGVK